MQLVAYGAQDVYLTGNPQITFWKVVYRRHTNFAMESIEQTFNGSADFGKRVTCTVSRNGDLVHKVYLQVSLGDLTGTDVSWDKALGHALIKSVEVEIGGQQIDKHYGEWMDVLHQLTCPAEKQDGIETMLGYNDGTTGGSQAAQTLYIPLQFWFCRNPGLAVPLIALHYHEVKINLEFNALAHCHVSSASDGAATMSSAALWVDYIYLDTDERRRFAQVSHEYLIEQLQFTGSETLSAGANKVRMNFNHPVKELVWCEEKSTTDAGDRLAWQSMDQTNAGDCKVKMLLNGHDRFAERQASYFNLVQPYQHHTRVPNGSKVHCYSFALKPEEHQPSGSCNFSRIDNATLSLSGAAAGNLRVFAVNYNVLRVMSGMGGLAYSN
jgi:hypothetical protein